MNNTFQSLLTVLGRVMIALIFLMSALGNKIPNFSGTVEYMSSAGVPAPRMMLAGAILFLLAGSASIILGYKAKVGASLLLVFLALATFFFHDFWTFTGQDRQAQTIQFMKNLSLMGTMVFLMANGSGPASLDSRLAKHEDRANSHES